MFRLLLGVLLPFFGTCAGAFLVFFLKDNFNSKLNKIMLGFAAGVMMASSVWSLIIPAISQLKNDVYLSIFSVVLGILTGVLFMLLLDEFCLKITSKATNKTKKIKGKTSLLFWAITIHNIPEGMAVGVALASAFWGVGEIVFASALAISTGIAIQNIPEGAIVSIPLKTENFSKGKSFLFGALSGIVEPLFAIITIFLVKFVNPILPYLLSFAAGAMIYVSVEELIPESHSEENSKIGSISFVIGFLIMMTLDIVLG